MSGPEVLTELFSQVRGYTLQFLTKASDEALWWRPANLQNHILWRSGHALWVIDCLAVEPLVGRSELPAGWAETFGEGSRPSEVVAWPDREEVRSRLVEQRERFLGLLRELEPSQLSGPARGLSASRNLGGWILHAIHDEALHQGESFLTLKTVVAST